VAASEQPQQAAPELAQVDFRVLAACQPSPRAGQQAVCPVYLALAAPVNPARKGWPDDLRAAQKGGQQRGSDHVVSTPRPAAHRCFHGGQTVPLSVVAAVVLLRPVPLPAVSRFRLWEANLANSMSAVHQRLASPMFPTAWQV